MRTTSNRGRIASRRSGTHYSNKPPRVCESRPREQREHSNAHGACTVGFSLRDWYPVRSQQEPKSLQQIIHRQVTCKEWQRTVVHVPAFKLAIEVVPHLVLHRLAGQV